MKQNILFLLIFFIYACQRNTETSIQKQPPVSATSESINDSCAYFLNECRMYDDMINKSQNFDKQIAIKANNSFVKYGLLCKNDSLCPIYLMKAAQLSQAIGYIQMSEKYLLKVITDYNKSKLLPAAKFLLAQYYSDTKVLNKPEQAKKLLNEIIKDYPNTVWAENATAALKWVGQSDEKIIREIKKSK